MKKTAFAAAAAAAMIFLASCAGPGSGKEFHTLFSGEGTRAPETVIVTLPPETVIVTVPVPAGTATPPEDTATPVTSERGTSAPENTSGTPGTSPSGAAFEIADSTLSLGGSSSAALKYPVFSELPSETVRKKLNEQLAEMAKFDFQYNERCKDYQDRIAEGQKVVYRTLSCDVTFMNDAFISVRWSAEYTAGNSDPLPLVFAHYMNLSTGKEIKPKDLFSDIGSVLDLLAAGKMKLVESTKNFASELDLELAVKQFRAGISYNTYPVTYMTGEGLVLIVSLDNPAGDFGEYFADFGSVGKYLKVTP